MRNKVCEKCGNSFACGADTGSCWCRKLPPAQIAPGSYKDCVCEDCLRLHTQPLREGLDYNINAKGLMVLTREYLLRRGYCCANGCVNCPYED